MARTIAAAVVALALVAGLAPWRGESIERRFSTAVYPLVQRTLTPMSNRVPFALFDLLTVGAGLGLAFVVGRAILRARRTRRWRPLFGTLARLGVAAAALYLAFLGLWGFNYRRVPMSERLVMAPASPTTEQVRALGDQAVARLNGLHAGAHARGWAEDPWRDERLIASFHDVQRALTDAPAPAIGRLKRSIYGPYFRWSGVDGMVNPFALEVIENPDLLPFERPFVAAHEWAHLAGFADESEANFVGWLACVRAGVPAQYSGWLYLFWQVSGELGGDGRTRMWEALDAGPRRDVEAVVARLRAGQLPLLRDASWAVYDQYLRANRVESGVRSYGEVITLLLRASFADGWMPVRR